MGTATILNAAPAATARNPALQTVCEIGASGLLNLISVVAVGHSFSNRAEPYTHLSHRLRDACASFAKQEYLRRGAPQMV